MSESRGNALTNLLADVFLGVACFLIYRIIFEMFRKMRNAWRARKIDKQEVPVIIVPETTT